MSLENCKDFINQLYKYFHGKYLYENTDNIDEESDIDEDDYMDEGNTKKSDAFPSERLRLALSGGIRNASVTPSLSEASTSENNKNKIASPTTIPTKITINLSKRSEQKLFELGCYLSRSAKAEKEEVSQCSKNEKDQTHDFVKRIKLEKSVKPLKKIHGKRLIRISHTDQIILPSQYCKYKKRVFTMIVGKQDLKDAYLQEKMLDRIKKNGVDDTEEMDPKLVENKNPPKSFEKKSGRPYSFTTMCKKKRLNPVKKSNDSISLTHAVRSQPKPGHLPETKNLNISGVETKVNFKKYKNKRVQTNYKEMLKDLGQLLKKHKRLQQRNKSLSENLSCLLTHFETKPSEKLDLKKLKCETIQSSSIPINNLHKIFQKEEFQTCIM